MITKVYRLASLSRFTLPLLIVPAMGCKPVRKRIAFEPMSQANVGSSYTTNNRQEQLAIEALDMFKRGEIVIHATYGLEPSERVDVKKAEACDGKPEAEVCQCGAEIKEYVRVTTVQGAANVLVRDYGADPDEVDDIDKILAYGKKVGASFPKLQ